MFCPVSFYALAVSLLSLSVRPPRGLTATAAYAASELRLLRLGGGASLRSTPQSIFKVKML